MDNLRYPLLDYRRVDHQVAVCHALGFGNLLALADVAFNRGKKRLHALS